MKEEIMILIALDHVIKEWENLGCDIDDHWYALRNKYGNNPPINGVGLLATEVK